MSGQELAPAQPQGLQVVDELVEELEVEPADRVDEAGVLLGHVIDQPDDALGHEVARRCLAGEERGAGLDI